MKLTACRKQKNETEFSTALFLWRKRKCYPNSSLVYAHCTIADDCNPKDGSNKEGIFSRSFISPDPSDKFTRCI